MLVWRRFALTACVCLTALAVTGPAFAGGSTGLVRLHIHVGGVPHAPVAARPAPPVKASAPGPTGSLTLRILPATIGFQALAAAGDWQRLLPIWINASNVYGVPWQVLAAINKVESNDGANLGPSVAGAVGWMQFMPGTWAVYGLDASGDGVGDPNNPTDAIASAARYLAVSGARTNLPRAIFAYNHAWWYVDEVLALARSYGYR